MSATPHLKKDFSGRYFEQTAPEIEVTLNQCNRSCRQQPRLGAIEDQWFARCMCSSAQGADAHSAAVLWNMHNPMRKLASRAEIAARHALNKFAK